MKGAEERRGGREKLIERPKETCSCLKKRSTCPKKKLIFEYSLTRQTNFKKFFYETKARFFGTPCIRRENIIKNRNVFRLTDGDGYRMNRDSLRLFSQREAPWKHC